MSETKPPEETVSPAPRRRSSRHAFAEQELRLISSLVLLIGLGLATLGLTLVAAGYGFRGWAVIAGVVCVVSFIVGTLAILMEHRRVKRLEGQELFDQEGH